MKTNQKVIRSMMAGALSIALLGVMFYQRASANMHHGPHFTSNFFTFWLPGHMVLNGENPDNETQYLAEHDAFGVIWKPNKIFPYPLPLSLLMVPLGLLPLTEAYFVWQIVSLIIIAVAVFVLLGHWGIEAQGYMLAPLMIFFLFFGPVYVTLKVGSTGALFLLIVLHSLLLFEKQKSLAAGIVLSLTILKPPQGLPILLLAGVWSLARKDWRAITGMTLGGLGILLVGMIQDPLWVIKFRGASQSVMDRTQGIQSNVWAYSYLICRGQSPCSIVLGGLSALALLGLCSFFLWRNSARLSAWEAFNVIIPVGFIATIYLWGYDQILYVIPILWIAYTLIERRKSYIPAAVVLIAIELVAFGAMTILAYRKSDLWNAGNTVIVLGMFLWLFYAGQKNTGNTSIVSVESNPPTHGNSQ